MTLISVKTQPQHRWWPAVLAVTLYLFLTGAALIGARLLDLDTGVKPAGSATQAMAWPGIWARWDSGFYVTIAQYGYSANDLSSAFYPLYPLLIRIGNGLLGVNSIAVGTLLSLAFSAIAFTLLWYIVAYDYGVETAKLTVILLALFPTSLYFYAVYTEALFLLISVAGYVLARTGRWRWAALVCLLAGFVRYNGFLIPVLVALEYLLQKGFRRSHWFQAGLFLVMGLAGFMFYQLYLWATFGDILLSFKSQYQFGKRYVTWPWVSVFDTLQVAVIGKGVESNWFWRLVGWQELLFTGFFALLSIASWKYLRASLATYFSLSLLMFLCSHGPYSMGLLSMPRYLLPLFPAYMVAALLLNRHAWRWSIVTIMAIMLVLYVIWFASGRWVA